MQNLQQQEVYKEKLEPILKSIYKKYNTSITFFDLETSGLDIKTDEILQIYVCKYDGTDFIERTELFNIHGEIRKEAFEKHKISKESLKDYPYFSEVAEQIYNEYFSDTKTIICGFNSNKFDVPFIIEKFLASKVLQSTSITKNPKIDVYSIYRELYPNTLEGIYKRFTGEVLENSHSADSDIMATMVILGKLMNDNPETEFIDSTRMVDAGGFFKIDNDILKFTMGKYKDMAVSSIDTNELQGYLTWILNNNSFGTHTKVIARKIFEKVTKE